MPLFKMDVVLLQQPFGGKKKKHEQKAFPWGRYYQVYFPNLLKKIYINLDANCGL